MKYPVDFELGTRHLQLDFTGDFIFIIFIRMDYLFNKFSALGDSFEFIRTKEKFVIVTDPELCAKSSTIEHPKPDALTT